MTVYPEYMVKNLKGYLHNTFGIVLNPSKLDPKYYTISTWDRSKFKTAKDVKSFLKSNFKLKPFSYREGDLCPTLVDNLLV